MSQKSLVERAREHRSRGSVLKVQLSNLRSKCTDSLVFVLEGVDDIGPFHVWVSRIRDDVKIEFLPACGKSQVLDLLRRLRADQTGLAKATYLFVDRDFDGLRGEAAGPDVFCTETYSIENYLVSERVLKSILADELGLGAGCDSRDEIINIYNKVLHEFVGSIREVNKRIYFAIQLNIRDINITDNVSQYLDVSLLSVESRIADPASVVRLGREPTAEEIDLHSAAFDCLDPVRDFRGKFFLAFFRLWLRRLADECRKPEELDLQKLGKIRFSDNAITLRALASRSALPDGLREFVLAATLA